MSCSTVTPFGLRGNIIHKWSSVESDLWLTEVLRGKEIVLHRWTEGVNCFQMISVRIKICLVGFWKVCIRDALKILYSTVLVLKLNVSMYILCIFLHSVIGCLPIGGFISVDFNFDSEAPRFQDNIQSPPHIDKIYLVLLLYFLLFTQTSSV